MKPAVTVSVVVLFLNTDGSIKTLEEKRLVTPLVDNPAQNRIFRTSVS
jgi:hypothetical protein